MLQCLPGPGEAAMDMEDVSSLASQQTRTQTPALNAPDGNMYSYVIWKQQKDPVYFSCCLWTDRDVLKLYSVNQEKQKW